LNTVAKERLTYLSAGAVAVLAGIWIAGGSWVLVGMMASAVGFCALAYLAPQGTHMFVLGVLVCGYVVGNRGFAQLSPAGRLPLFPAELGLIVSGSLLLIQSCVQRRLPFYIDGLNVAIAIWIGVGLLRIPFDVKEYGFAALRDFALIYYAVFFFISQAALIRHGRPTEWLQRMLLVTTALLLPLHFLFLAYPGFFTDVLTFRGVPLIFYKGDLVGTFLSIGSIVWYLHYAESPRRLWALVISLALAGAMLTTDNRASLLALVAATMWLAVTGKWQFFRILFVSGLLAAAGVLLWAQVQGKRLEQTPLYSMYEKVASIGDIYGQRTYSASASAPKGDNNRFRAVWWQTVITDTLQTNPYVGVGFGYDLAENFLRTYYPDSTDDFTARSPHNVFITVFARTGALGLLCFLALSMVLARKTFAAMRTLPVSHYDVPWCTVWAILTASCFGVVLEGPMGAVIFWIALGAGSAALVLNRDGAPRARAGQPLVEVEAENQFEDRSRHDILQNRAG
jgi:hypothetical protein